MSSPFLRRAIPSASAPSKSCSRSVEPHTSCVPDGWNLLARFAPGTVFLLDSIGELASVYSVADLAFVGGGLFMPGGHNPLEPAQFGVPVVMGPHYENFRAIVEKLLAADAIAVVEIKEIPSTFQQLLTNENAAREMGARARKVFESDAGATEAAADALLEIVGLGTGVRS